MVSLMPWYATPLEGTPYIFADRSGMTSPTVKELDSGASYVGVIPTRSVPAVPGKYFSSCYAVLLSCFIGEKAHRPPFFLIGKERVASLHEQG